MILSKKLFVKKLSREIIPIDARKDLLIPGVEYWDELNEYEALNVQKAIKHFIFGKTKKWPITDPMFLRRVHGEMFGDVWGWAGQWRKGATILGVPFTDIGMEVRKLCDDLSYWLENKTFSDEEMAIRYHHRLVWIHMFVNGNGRHARVMADLLMRYLDQEPFSWGGEWNERQRERYIKAIEAADQHSYEELLRFARSANR